MAKAQGLTLKDLLETQRKLAAAGDESAKKQVARLEGIASGAANPTASDATAADQVKIFSAQLEEAKRNNQETIKQGDDLRNLEEMTRKGLLDKSGDGLNSNVIKMSKDIRAMLSKSVAAAKPEAATPASTEKKDRVSIAAKESAANYQPGFGGSLKDTFTLKGMFDLDRASGPLGAALKKKVAKDDFIKNEKEVNPQDKEDPKYQNAEGKYDPKLHDRAIGERFENINDVRGGQKENQVKIANLQEQGYVEEDIQRAGLRKRESDLDAKMAEVDPRYAKQVEAAALVPKKDNVVSILANSKKGLVGAPKDAVNNLPVGGAQPTSLAAALPGLSTEDKQENARLMQEQTEVLKKIEENTRGLGGARKEGATATAAPSGPATPEGGGILSDVADFAMDKFGKRGGAGKAAKGLGGKALKFMGSKGGAIAGAALAVGAGAYTAYDGWQTASQNEETEKKSIDQAVATGQITKEEGKAKKVEVEQKASVGKGEAVGEGGGMAAGAIGGMALGAKAGALIGSVIPGAGTVVGGLVGGALGGAVGGIAGSSAGKAIGGYAVKGYQGVKSMFGFGGDEAAKPVAGAPVAAAEPPDVVFKRAKMDQTKVGGRTIEGFEGGYNLSGKKEDVDAATAAFKKFNDADMAGDTATADKAASEFKQLATKIGSPEYKATMKEISDKQAKKKGKATTDSKAAPEGKAPAVGPGAVVSESKQKIAGEDVVPGQPLSAKQAAVADMSMRSGNKLSPEVMKSYEMTKQQASAVAPTPTSADQIASKSAENAASQGTQVSAPTIISAPSNSTNVQNQTLYSSKSPARNTDSTISDYARSRYAY